MANDVMEEIKKKKKQGGLRTMPFILANEVFDRFAAAGFNANMITYLTEQLHMPMVQAANTLTNFSGTSSFTPIIGALVADSFAGRFWTIAAGSVVYQLGMLSLTISAALPALRPPPCSGRTGDHNATCPPANGIQLAFLYASLLVSAIGSGGIRPCVVAFGADQIDFLNAAAKKWNFFNFYFFCMGFATLLALTVVVYIQENVSWAWGLGIPTIGMFFSVVFFVAGHPLFVKKKPGGSPLTRLAQVIVSAFRKRKVARPSDPGLLYQNKELDADISTTGKLLHTEQMKFFDRAAIVSGSGDFTATGQPKLWHLSTVHRVEELKTIIRMIPIWAVGILLVVSTSHSHTFALLQARSMNRHLSKSFEIPPATLSVFTVVSMLLSLAAYDRVLIPALLRLTGRSSIITYFQRLGVGLVILIVSNATAAIVEAKRKAVAFDHGLLDDPKATIPISVFWLVPQYAITGVAEAFMSVAHMEFLYDQSPESMRSTAAALFWLASSIGNYTGTLLVTTFNDMTHGEWLQTNINRGKLDYYYWLVGAIQTVNLANFIICAKFYTFKPLEVAKPDDAGEGDGRHVELISED